ncbi:MAG: glycosyltransferase [Casimicrobiaceae bacterium]
MRRPTIVQFNLSPTLGGAEVYTAFFSRALESRGWRTRVVVNPVATFWNGLDFGAVSRVNFDAAAGALSPGEVALVHSPLPAAALAGLAGERVIGVAHQTLYDGKRPAYYDRADMMLAVSRHVIDSLLRNGLRHVYPTPLYGVADLQRGDAAGLTGQGPLFDVDARKPRDRLLGVLDRARRALASPQSYRRLPGFTLGIVSRLAPLKQFPVLFEYLAPILARQHDLNVEVFGSAVGYRTLRELRRALRPMGSRVRYWGHQRDIVSAYGAIDYLLTGLPEREALGLNALEACLAGTPVLAVAAPPFTETLKHGATGFLYADPRTDAGADFERVLRGIRSGTLVPNRAAAALHLEGFAFPRFADRVDGVLREITADTGRNMLPTGRD